MEFSFQKCGMLVLERVKVVGCERLSYPAGHKINKGGKCGYRYHRILDLNKVKQQLKKLKKFNKLRKMYPEQREQCVVLWEQ